MGGQPLRLPAIAAIFKDIAQGGSIVWFAEGGE